MPGQLQRRDIARAFHRASASYDAAARLQAVVRAELLSRLEAMRLPPQVVLDLGCGTGIGSSELKRRYPRAQVIAADIAPGMLAQARRRSRFWRRFHCLAADALQLPLKSQSVDLVFSSLMFQWCEEPDLAFAEVQRVLRPGGLLLFSSFGPDTLRELREAWAQVDAAAHVNAFIDMHDLGSALQRGGFSEPVLDVDRHVLRYPDAAGLMHELKAIGAHNVNRDRARTLTGPGRVKAMTAAYERLREPAGLPATYEVVYAAAWGAGQGAFAAPLAAETTVSLERFSAALRGRRP